MEIHHLRGIEWDLSPTCWVPGKLMNIVLDVAQGVLGGSANLVSWVHRAVPCCEFSDTLW